MTVRWRLFASLVAAAGFVVGGMSSAQAASAPDYSGVGSSSVAPASAGARTIYVDDQGSDVVGVNQPWGYVEYNRVTCLDTGTMPANQPSCPEPTINQPLRTVQAGVKIAKPGDVI